MKISFYEGFIVYGTLLWNQLVNRYFDLMTKKQMNNIRQYYAYMEPFVQLYAPHMNYKLEKNS